MGLIKVGIQDVLAPWRLGVKVFAPQELFLFVFKEQIPATGNIAHGQVPNVAAVETG